MNTLCKYVIESQLNVKCDTFLLDEMSYDNHACCALCVHCVHCVHYVALLYE